MLKIFDNLIVKLIDRNPWNDVYGLAQSILSFSLFLTLSCNDIYELYKPLAYAPEVMMGIGLGKFSLFMLFPLPVAKLIAIVLLIPGIIGFYPRIASILHFFVVSSFLLTCFLADGGEQVNFVISMLLLPLALTDNRKWSWDNKPIDPLVVNRFINFRRMIASSSFLIIRLQVFFIYFEACVAKFKSPEWANGTAVYYWMIHPQFGLSEWATNFFLPILANPIFIVLLTWGVLLFEGLLFMGLCMPYKYKKILLPMGIIFHFLILLVHGLPTFFLSMTAALIMYLHNPYEPIKVIYNLKRWFLQLSKLPMRSEMIEKLEPQRK